MLILDLRRIHRVLTSSSWIVPVFVLWAFFARIIAGVTFYEYLPWVVFAIQVIIAVLLMRINHEYRLIERRCVFPATFFLMFTASDPNLYSNLAGNISALLVVVCLVVAFKNYHNTKSQTSLFNIALILTLGSLFCWTPLLFFIPLFWIGFQWFRSFNIRSFFASLLGVLIVYLFLSAWCLYLNDWTLFFDEIYRIGEIFEIHWLRLQWFDWILWTYIILLMVISAVNIFVSGFSGKVKITLFFKFIYLIAIASMVLAFFFYAITDDIRSVIGVLLAFIAGYYFTMLDNNKWITYQIFFTILLFVAYYVYLVGTG